MRWTLLVFFAFGCGVAEDRVSTDSPGVGPDVERVLAALAVGGLPACGGGIAPPPDELFLLNAFTCLDCAPLGLFIRQRQRDTVASVAIITGNTHLEVVCDFARRERLHVPIVALPTIDSIALAQSIYVIRSHSWEWAAIKRSALELPLIRQNLGSDK